MAREIDVQPMAEPSLLDARHYRDPDQFQREIERIFHRSWLPVCPTSDVEAPRQHVLWERFGQSVVIVRLDDGSLAAWHNVCQHRGARLVSESGHCPTGSFKCPWHGFTYDLSGAVTNVPLREAFDPDELAGLRTPQVQVREWASFVWIALTPEVAPLEDYLGELKDELEGYGLEHYRTPYRGEWEIDANWKTVVDGFNETWHVPFTHTGSLASMVRWREAVLSPLGRHSMMTIPYRTKNGNGNGAADNDHRETMLCHYLSFPNTIFSCFPTHLQMFTAWPVAPNRTVLAAWGLMGPTPAGMSDDEWQARGERDWAHFLTVVEEDKVVLDAAGKVAGSLGFRRNMFNTAEGRLTAFHAHVNELAGEAR